MIGRVEFYTPGHNYHNNGQILPLIELDLYFMIIYLCIKYESNTLMFSEDIKWKLFFNVEKGPQLPKIIGGFYPKSNLRRGGSNEYPQSTFFSRNEKINVDPCKPQFYFIKEGF